MRAMLLYARSLSTETEPSVEGGETHMELIIDTVLGVCFLVAAIICAERLKSTNSQAGSENKVITAFYTLILLTSGFRSIYFLVPKELLEPRYTPSAVMAFDPENPHWFSNYASEVVLTIGSLCLFSIFILILVYWADILKKYFQPGARRDKPMRTFAGIVVVLVLVQLVNSIMFLSGKYSTEGMILVNSVLLSTVSIVCVVQLLMFSHKFRTVLKTLGAINQVSTASQDERIKWITLTGNAFFISRALLEIVLAFSLIFFYMAHGSLDEVFKHKDWDLYVIFKYGSEFAILCLMLYILKSQFNANASDDESDTPNSAEYDKIPENEPAKKAPVSNDLAV